MENQIVEIEKADIEKELESYDIVFSLEHVQKLLYRDTVENVKLYLKQFFFKFGKCTFFYDAITSEFELLTNAELSDTLPNDLVKKNFELKKTVEFAVKDYFKSTEFMNNKYYPTINFNQDRVFTVDKKIDGKSIK